jgi:hypothetical protein
MADRKYYVLCQNNCKFEGMTKEQIIAAIAEATGKTPTDIDSAFISKIKEINKGAAVQIWIGATAEYNALVANGEKRSDVIYIKTDDSALADFESYFIQQISSINNKVAQQKEEIANAKAANAAEIFSLNLKLNQLQNEKRVIYNLTWNASTNEITNGDEVAAQLYEDITGGKNVEMIVNNGTYEYIAILTDRNKGIFAVLAPRFQRIYSWTCNGASIKFLNEQYIASECVVASGTQGNWSFRQWASGVAECWGTVKFALSKDAYEWAAGTGIYCASGYGNGSDGSDTIPNIFTSYDCVSIDPIQWYQIGGSGRVTAGGTLEANVFGKGDNMTALKKGDTVSVNCIVKGKWK